MKWESATNQALKLGKQRSYPHCMDDFYDPGLFLLHKESDETRRFLDILLFYDQNTKEAASFAEKALKATVDDKKSRKKESTRATSL